MPTRYITRIDGDRRANHRFQNRLQSIVLVVAMLSLMCVAAALLWGFWGAVLSIGCDRTRVGVCSANPGERCYETLSRA